MADPRSRFEARFATAARLVRSRLRLGRVLTGIASGSCAAVVLAAGLWLAKEPALRPFAGGVVLVGALAGGVVARLRRPTHEEVAMLLDARLASEETITTAAMCDLAARGHETESRRVTLVVFSRASLALEQAPRNALRLPVLRSWHWLIPVCVLGFAFVVRLPITARQQPMAPPGVELLHVADVQGLEKVIALGALEARDDAQRERLKKLAAEAERIRKRLEDGAQKREARADLAKLSDDIAAERMSLGDGQERKGLEAAMAALGKIGDLDRAEKALGDHDLTAFDDEMQRAANQVEKSARDRVKKALEEAEAAAKKAGAKGVSKMLAEQREAFDEQEKRSAELRDLEQAIGSELDADGRDAQRDLEANGDPEAARRLAKSMQKALEGLSREERKKLAERMKALALDASSPESKDSLKKLSERLDSAEGTKKLEEDLRSMANATPQSEESRRQQALEEAQRGLAPGTPVPMLSGRGSNGASGAAGPGTGSGTGAGGRNGDSGRAPSKKGSAPPTAKVDASELRAHADARLGAGAPMPGMVTGRTSGRPGETANVRGTGALGTVAPGEVFGVSRGDVPEEYREQVGRYFQP